MNIETLFANTLRDYLKTGYQGVTFTADATANTITAALDAAPNTSAVRLTTTGTLPAPLVAGTTYYVRDKSANVRKLALTSGGAAIDLTDTGTGAHTITPHTDLLPAPSALSYIATHERGDKVRPLITVEVKRDEQTHPELAVLMCMVKIEINVATPNASGTGFTDPATAETWIKSLRAHLADKARFTAFVDTLSESDRTGWQLLLHYLPPYFTPEIEAGDQERTYEQALQITCRVIEPS